MRPWWYIEGKVAVSRLVAKGMGCAKDTLEARMRAFLLAMVVVSCLPALAFGQETIDFCGQTFSVIATEVCCEDVTVSDVSALSALTNLESLDLRETQVSSEQVETLKTALPKLKIKGP